MLKALKFVSAAVARKDFVPALTFFRIAEGRVASFNGALALSAPIDLDIVAMPKATSFAKAMERLPDSESVTMNLTATGKLTIKSRNARFHVECWGDDHFPRVVPEGDIHPMPGGILPVLRKLAPFMGIDASRPWAMGILLKNQSAYATNNVVLIEHWLPVVFPTPICIPAEAVKAMLAFGREPVSMQSEPSRITFHFDDGSWLSTALVSTEWPDLSRVLDQPHNATELPAGFFDAVNRLDAFVEKTNRLHIRGPLVATSEHEGVGAVIELDGLDGKGCHHLSEMSKLEGVATKLDLHGKHAPCLFFGDMLRGAIIGMRVNDAV